MQALVLSGSALVLGWTIIATAVLLMDSIGSGNARERSQRELATYENRLDALSRERDARASEAAAAQERFAVALQQVSAMQSTLLTSEERRRELETGIGVIQSTLRRTMTERDEALGQTATLTAALNDQTGTSSTDAGRAEDVAATLDFLTSALGRTAVERDAMEKVADTAMAETETIALEKRLLEESHNQIFSQLEDAVTVSMAPLDKMFTEAGMDPDDLISQVRRGYSGQGGPLMPISFSTKGDPNAAGVGRKCGARGQHPGRAGPDEHVPHRRRKGALRGAAEIRVPLHLWLWQPLGPPACRHRFRRILRHADLCDGGRGGRACRLAVGLWAAGADQA